jgi:hypothetical protein
LKERAPKKLVDFSKKSFLNGIGRARVGMDDGGRELKGKMGEMEILVTHERRELGEDKAEVLNRSRLLSKRLHEARQGRQRCELKLTVELSKERSEVLNNVAKDGGDINLQLRLSDLFEGLDGY